MIDVIYGAFYSLTATIISLNFIRIFLRGKRDIKVTYALVLLLCFLNVAFSHVLNDYFIAKVTAVVLVNIIFVYLIFNASIIKSAIYYLMYYGIGLLCDTVVAIVGMIFIPQYGIRTSDNSPITIFLGSCSLVVQVLVIVILHYLFEKRVSKSINLKMVLKVVIFSTFSIIYNIYIILNYNPNYPTKITYLCLFTCLGFVFMNVLMFMMLRDIYYNDVNSREIIIQTERYNNMNQMYQKIIDRHNTDKKYEHDINKHLMVLSKLADDNDIEKLKKYLAEYGNSLPRDIIYTNNKIINAVINSKYSEFFKNDIVPIMNIDVKEKLVLSDVEITAVLSNILDNAIEACEKVPENRYIKIILEGDKEYINIIAINSYSGKIYREKDKFVSSKKDVAGHGIGIENVKEIVYKHNGYIDFDYDEKEFKISISI